MSHYRRDPRIDQELARAVSHPLRLLILRIAAGERYRYLSVRELTAALAITPGLEHVEAKQVLYHRNRLLDAELLPKR